MEREEGRSALSKGALSLADRQSLVNPFGKEEERRRGGVRSRERVLRNAAPRKDPLSFIFHPFLSAVLESGCSCFSTTEPKGYGSLAAFGRREGKKKRYRAERGQRRLCVLSHEAATARSRAIVHTLRFDGRRESANMSCIPFRLHYLFACIPLCFRRVDVVSILIPDFFLELVYFEKLNPIQSISQICIIVMLNFIFRNVSIF